MIQKLGERIWLYLIRRGELVKSLILFGNRLKMTGVTLEIEQVQKTVLIGTARILRKVLKI